MFPTCKNSQKRAKNQKSTDKHLSVDGVIQEDIDLSDIYLAVKYKLMAQAGFKVDDITRVYFRE